MAAGGRDGGGGRRSRLSPRPQCRPHHHAVPQTGHLLSRDGRLAEDHGRQGAQLVVVELWEGREEGVGREIKMCRVDGVRGVVGVGSGGENGVYMGACGTDRLVIGAAHRLACSNQTTRLSTTKHIIVISPLLAVLH